MRVLKVKTAIILFSLLTSIHASLKMEYLNCEMKLPFHELPLDYFQKTPFLRWYKQLGEAGKTFKWESMDAERWGTLSFEDMGIFLQDLLMNWKNCFHSMEDRCYFYELIEEFYTHIKETQYRNVFENWFEQLIQKKLYLYKSKDIKNGIFPLFYVKQNIRKCIKDTNEIKTLPNKYLKNMKHYYLLYDLSVLDFFYVLSLSQLQAFREDALFLIFDRMEKHMVYANLLDYFKELYKKESVFLKKQQEAKEAFEKKRLALLHEEKEEANFKEEENLIRERYDQAKQFQSKINSAFEYMRTVYLYREQKKNLKGIYQGDLEKSLIFLKLLQYKKKEEQKAPLKKVKNIKSALLQHIKLSGFKSFTN